ncbi:uncharacterized protein EDB93DRAFT_442115 [Suillus bovinus]|uniref:uncharacterized protein n=1 Tax=Suillus bovinus TaxID=48563 RepID=UPI001B87324B|nr:uncharacterized protein EDB93DRAFT_442115 [Suillus bovinus]KAG2159072.1 hypothetical protein EDB93DRAFT_442115 [Suillus bovinus]
MPSLRVTVIVKECRIFATSAIPKTIKSVKRGGPRNLHQAVYDRQRAWCPAESAKVVSSPAFKSSASTSELERRVLTLQNMQVPSDVPEATSESVARSLSYTDEELSSMYEDLLEIPRTQKCVEVRKLSEEDRDTPAIIEVRERVQIYVRCSL